MSLVSPALAGGFFTAEPPGKPLYDNILTVNNSTAVPIKGLRNFKRSSSSFELVRKAKTSQGGGIWLCLEVQFSPVAQSCLTICDPMIFSTPGLPVNHQLPESTQTHVHWVGNAIQPSYPLSSPSPPALNLSQLQGLFQWVSSSHQVAKVLELQLQHQSFQWIFRTDFLWEYGHLINIGSSNPRTLCYIFIFICFVFNFFSQHLIVFRVQVFCLLRKDYSSVFYSFDVMVLFP